MLPFPTFSHWIKDTRKAFIITPTISNHTNSCVQQGINQNSVTVLCVDAYFGALWFVNAYWLLSSSHGYSLISKLSCLYTFASTAAAQTGSIHLQCWGVWTFSGRRMWHKVSHSNVLRRGAGLGSSLGRKNSTARSLCAVCWLRNYTGPLQTQYLLLFGAINSCVLQPIVTFD